MASVIHRPVVHPMPGPVVSGRTALPRKQPHIGLEVWTGDGMSGDADGVGVGVLLL